MAEARETILRRIRGSLAEAGVMAADAAAEYAGLERAYSSRGALAAEARLHLFLERLRDYDAQVVETAADSLPRAIAGVLAGHAEKKVVAADGLPPEMLPGEFAFLAERDAEVEDLNDCDGIVTACTVAIASTGSLVLTHGPGEGRRRLSLLPDRHLCIVRAEQVVETVPEAMERLAPYANHPMTFISGPSATADIEMTRIRGVHGPRFLDVVLVR